MQCVPSIYLSIYLSIYTHTHTLMLIIVPHSSLPYPCHLSTIDYITVKRWNIDITVNMQCVTISKRSSHHSFSRSTWRGGCSAQSQQDKQQCAEMACSSTHQNQSWRGLLTTPNQLSSCLLHLTLRFRSIMVSAVSQMLHQDSAPSGASTLSDPYHLVSTFHPRGLLNTQSFSSGFFLPLFTHLKVSWVFLLSACSLVPSFSIHDFILPWNHFQPLQFFFFFLGGCSNVILVAVSVWNNTSGWRKIFKKKPQTGVGKKDTNKHGFRTANTGSEVGTLAFYVCSWLSWELSECPTQHQKCWLI